MDAATVSAKFQVVIPKRVRRALGLRPGQKLLVIPYAGRIELIPVRPMDQVRGSLPGIETTVPREADRV